MRKMREAVERETYSRKEEIPSIFNELVERETFNYSLKMPFANKYMKLSRYFAEKQLIFRLLCQLILLSG